MIHRGMGEPVLTAAKVFRDRLPIVVLRVPPFRGLGWPAPRDWWLGLWRSRLLRRTPSRSVSYQSQRTCQTAASKQPQVKSSKAAPWEAYKKPNRYAETFGIGTSGISDLRHI